MPDPASEMMNMGAGPSEIIRQATESGTPVSPQVSNATGAEPSILSRVGSGAANLLHAYAMVHTGLAAQEYQNKERERAEERQLYDAMFLKNPEMTQSPSAMATYKKITGSPERADFMQSWGATELVKRHKFEAQMAGAMGPSNAPSAASSADPMQAHLGELDDHIRRVEGLLGEATTNSPEHVPVLNTLLSDLRQQRTQLTGEAFSTQQQARSQAFSEQQQGRRDVAAEQRQEKSSAGMEERQQKSLTAQEERQNKAIAAQEERATRAMEHSDRMEGMRENFRLGLERLKDARTKKKFDSLIGTKAKERDSFTAKLNDPKTDQFYRQAEAETWNQGIDAMSTSIDDPEQAKQLEALKVAVDPATQRWGGWLSDKPGVVKPAESAPTFKAGDRRVKDGIAYERNDKGEWHPAK